MINSRLCSESLPGRRDFDHGIERITTEVGVAGGTKTASAQMALLWSGKTKVFPGSVYPPTHPLAVL
jgi:hypothetical protein